MPLGDVYMAMETGTIDGIVTCVPLILSFKLNEVAKHAVVATFGCVSEGVVMNKQSWNKIPDNLKPVVDEVCQNPFKTTGGLTRDVYKSMMKEVADKKVNLFELPSQEAEKWYERFQDVTRKWVADLEAKNLPAKEVVKMYNEECEKRGVRVAAFPKEWK
jgi:TRAP-type C4-dicarboxylate transport system substrate-binding protein